MKYFKIRAKIKRENLEFLDVARDLRLEEKELKDKLKGRKPLYIHEAEALFKCLDIKSGEEKIKFF